jgi:hypothetical protein
VFQEPGIDSIQEPSPIAAPLAANADETTSNAIVHHRLTSPIACTPHATERRHSETAARSAGFKNARQC